MVIGSVTHSMGAPLSYFSIALLAPNQFFTLIGAGSLTQFDNFVGVGHDRQFREWDLMVA